MKNYFVLRVKCMDEYPIYIMVDIVFHANGKGGNSMDRLNRQKV